MLIIMKSGASSDEWDQAVGFVEGLGHRADPLTAGDVRILRVRGFGELPSADLFEALPGVAAVYPMSHPPRHTVRQPGSPGTTIRVGAHTIGEGHFTLIAGPCAVENEEQLAAAARHARASGAHLLRGGAFKPRTSPFDFQGLGEKGLEMLARVSRQSDLPVVTEAVDEASLERIQQHADVVQIGSRNMQNFELLKRAGRGRLPVLLKRGMWATLEEFLMSAEYLMEAGNERVILCERGIRTFSDHSRYTLDIAVVPLLKRLSHLPVIVDPSHASGRRASVAPLARAALAVGADGVMVELHPEPGRALCDGAQSLTPDEFEQLAASLRALAPAVLGREETVS